MAPPRALAKQALTPTRLGHTQARGCELWADSPTRRARFHCLAAQQKARGWHKRKMLQSVRGSLTWKAFKELAPEEQQRWTDKAPCNDTTLSYYAQV